MKGVDIVTEFYDVKETKLFYTGAQYPPDYEIPRLAKYKRGKIIFEGRHPEIYERASSLLKDTPHAKQLQTLFIAVNIMDVLLTKPADLMVSEPPSFDTGGEAEDYAQKRLDSIIEENDITQMIHEMTIGGGIRGDSFLRTRYAPRADVSETLQLGLAAPTTPAEPIIEPVDALTVFPELSRGSKKRFKAINVAWVEWEVEKSSSLVSFFTSQPAVSTPYLNVERHIPGYIVYERYLLHASTVNVDYNVPIQTYNVGERVATRREVDIIETGTARLLIDHIPYKAIDDDWRGISGVEKLESVLSAINERLVQIDYILWKHSDPTGYGPDVDDGDASFRSGGRYIPVEKDEVIPGYMVWEGQLSSAFKQLDLLLGIVYQMSETPQWLFGTTVASDSGGGTGTSHTDGGAIKARFMPILTKVKRIRSHMDRAVRDALWKSMELENFANVGVQGFVTYTPTYPKIEWKDGIPRDEKAAAETAQIRTGGKATWSVADAIKNLDGVSDAAAADIIKRIDEDAMRTEGTVDASIFNDPLPEDDA